MKTLFKSVLFFSGITPISTEEGHDLIEVVMDVSGVEGLDQGDGVERPKTLVDETEIVKAKEEENDLDSKCFCFFFLVICYHSNISVQFF